MQNWQELIVTGLSSDVAALCLGTQLCTFFVIFLTNSQCLTVKVPG